METSVETGVAYNTTLLVTLEPYEVEYGMDITDYGGDHDMNGQKVEGPYPFQHINLTWYLYVAYKGSDKGYRLHDTPVIPQTGRITDVTAAKWLIDNQ